MRAVAVIAMTAGVLASCGASDGGDRTAGDGTLRIGGPASFALALGVDADQADTIAALRGYDLVVVDGQGTSAEAVEALQRGGARVLAYLSAGTVEPGRPWFDEAKDQGWLLDHWDDWDEWYADVAQPGLRALITAEAGAELDKGFDGLFLDNTDMVEGHPAQRDGMVELVASLADLAGPERLLFAQNGDPAAAGIVDHLDGWNREDVTSTYDFDTESYAPVSATDHRDAVRQLAELHDAGLIVTATDYFAEAGSELQDEATEAACGTGAVPFASDIGLTRIADPPTIC